MGGGVRETVVTVVLNRLQVHSMSQEWTRGKAAPPPPPPGCAPWCQREESALEESADTHPQGKYTTPLTGRATNQ